MDIEQKARAIPVFSDSETIRKQNGSLRTLLAAQETELAIHRAKAAEYHVATQTLDSERAANARLTEELEMARAALTSTQQQLEEARGVVRDLLPGKLCGEGWNLPDSETVSIVVTFGKLRAARALASLGDGR